MIDTEKIEALLELLARPDEPPRPAGASDAEIAALEDYLGTPLPADLRDWLRFSNGAFIGTVPAFGAHSLDAPLSIQRVLNRFPIWRDRRWIPVASDGCGNFYVIPTQGEYGDGFPVLFVEAVIDHSVPQYIVASDFGHFLIGMMVDELNPLDDEFTEAVWPFVEETVVRDDPEILKFHGVPLPWNT